MGANDSQNISCCFLQTLLFISAFAKACVGAGETPEHLVLLWQIISSNAFFCMG
jgi:hypothetical protein